MQALSFAHAMRPSSSLSNPSPRSGTRRPVHLITCQLVCHACSGKHDAPERTAYRLASTTRAVTLRRPPGSGQMWVFRARHPVAVSCMTLSDGAEFRTDLLVLLLGSVKETAALFEALIATKCRATLILLTFFRCLLRVSELAFSRIETRSDQCQLHGTRISPTANCGLQCQVTPSSV
jgi:hypothetical protein